MGLKSGENGVKAQCRKHFPGAFSSCPTLQDAVEHFSSTHGETMLLTDGNVLMHQTGTWVRSFDDFARVMDSHVEHATHAADIVVVVYDEPLSVTGAKADEQNRRDAVRPRQWQLGDAYTLEVLEGVEDIQHVLGDRTGRTRCIDEVCRRSLASPSQAGVLIFDGVDAAGADRPVGHPRQPGLHGCSREVPQEALIVTNVMHRSQPIGEGDVKLSAIRERVAYVSSCGVQIFEHVKLALVVTVDMDTICIELLRHAQNPDRKFRTVVCMRERPKRSEDGSFANHASYTCIDMKRLYDDLQEHVWGAGYREIVGRDALSDAMNVLVLGWILCGCDFTELKGLRADTVLCAMRQFKDARVVPSSLVIRESVVDRGSDLHSVFLSRAHWLCAACSEILASLPRMKRQSLSVSNLDTLAFRRAVWVLSYWNGVERECEAYGFETEKSRSDVRRVLEDMTLALERDEEPRGNHCAEGQPTARKALFHAAGQGSAGGVLC
jgi:hypothetical protein